MQIIHDERVVYPHQISKDGHLWVLCGEHSVRLDLHERVEPVPADAVDKTVATLQKHPEPGPMYVLVVRVKDDNQRIAIMGSLVPFGEFQHVVPGLGRLTESECMDKMARCLDNATKLYIKNKLIARKACKTGFARQKAKVLFAVAMQSNHEVMMLEMQTARDITGAMHNMDIAAAA